MPRMIVILDLYNMLCELKGVVLRVIEYLSTVSSRRTHSNILYSQYNSIANNQQSSLTWPHNMPHFGDTIRDCSVMTTRTVISSYRVSHLPLFRRNPTAQQLEPVHRNSNLAAAIKPLRYRLSRHVEAASTRGLLLLLPRLSSLSILSCCQLGCQLGDYNGKICINFCMGLRRVALSAS